MLKFHCNCFLTYKKALHGAYQGNLVKWSWDQSSKVTQFKILLDKEFLLKLTKHSVKQFCYGNSQIGIFSIVCGANHSLSVTHIRMKLKPEYPWDKKLDGQRVYHVKT